MGGGDTPPACYDVKGGVERNGGQRTDCKSTDNRGSVCSSNAVDGDVLTLVDMKENLVKCIPKVLMSVWHVTKVA